MSFLKKLVKQFKEELSEEIEHFKDRIEKTKRPLAKIDRNNLIDKELSKQRLREYQEWVNTPRHLRPEYLRRNPEPVYVSEAHKNKIVQNADGVWVFYQGEIIECDHLDRDFILWFQFRGYMDADLLYCEKCKSILYGSFISGSDNHHYPSVYYDKNHSYDYNYSRERVRMMGHEMNSTFLALVPKPDIY